MMSKQKVEYDIFRNCDLNKISVFQNLSKEEKEKFKEDLYNCISSSPYITTHPIKIGDKVFRLVSNNGVFDEWGYYPSTETIKYEYNIYPVSVEDNIHRDLIIKKLGISYFLSEKEAKDYLKEKQIKG